MEIQHSSSPAWLAWDSPSQPETLDSPTQFETQTTAAAEAPSGYEADDEEVSRPGEAHQQSLLSVIARKLPSIPPLRFTELELGPTAADEARARVIKAALATAEESVALPKCEPILSAEPIAGER